MARSKYPDSLNLVIAALMAAGRGQREIMDILAHDEAGIGRPIQIPRRTLAQRMKGIRDRGEDLTPADSVVTAAEDVVRFSMTIARRALKRLERKARTEPLTKEDLAAMREYSRIANEIRVSDRKAASASTYSARGGKGRARSVKSDSALGKLRRDIERERRDEPASPRSIFSKQGTKPSFDNGQVEATETNGDGLARSAESARSHEPTFASS